MLLCTIGFSKKGLRDFISRLQRAGITKVIDVRLNNTSQLAGYAKKDDLAYILELVGIEYEHRTDLAPTESLLKDYKQKRVTWDEYEQVFLHNLAKRNAWGKKTLFSDDHQAVCLLCSEDKPQYCHRRLVAEDYCKHFPNVQIKHL